MTEKNMMSSSAHDDDNAKSPAKVSRRALLRSGVSAMPVVLTLQSGAALARSSNLISAAPAGTTDLNGDTLCLDTSNLAPPTGNKYDLGQPAYGKVNVMSDRYYYPEPNRSSSAYSAGVACNRGGTHYYQSSGWKQANLPANNIVVSATALVSVSARGEMFINRIS